MCYICLMWWRKSWDCKGGSLFILTPWIYIYRYWVYVKHEFCWLDLWWSLILRWPVIKSQEKYVCLGYKYYKCDKLRQKRQIFFQITALILIVGNFDLFFSFLFMILFINGEKNIRKNHHIGLGLCNYIRRTVSESKI